MARANSTGCHCAGVAAKGLRLGVAKDRGGLHDVPIVVAFVFVLVIVMRRLGAGGRRLFEGGIEYVCEWGGLR